MAFHTVEADMPWIDLPGGYKLRFEAINTTTGAAVTGCSVQNVAVYGESLALGQTLERIIPRWVPDEVGSKA